MSNENEQPENSEKFVRNLDTVESDDRVSRSSEDLDRTYENGTALMMLERKALLRQEWNDDILPSIPPDGKYHYIWLSTTSQNDPIYRRQRLGYQLVRKEQLPHLALKSIALSAEYEGYISVNEMVLARIELELYNELMLINHHERPLEEERLLKANIKKNIEEEEDSQGEKLGEMIGEGIKNLGRPVRPPSFI